MVRESDQPHQRLSTIRAQHETCKVLHLLTRGPTEWLNDLQLTSSYRHSIRLSPRPDIASPTWVSNLNLLRAYTLCTWQLLHLDCRDTSRRNVIETALQQRRTPQAESSF